MTWPRRATSPGSSTRSLPVIAALGQRGAERVLVERVAGLEPQVGFAPGVSWAHALQDRGGAGQEQAGRGGGLSEAGERLDPAADHGCRRGDEVVGQHVPGRQCEDLDAVGEGGGEPGDALEPARAAQDGQKRAAIRCLLEKVERECGFGGGGRHGAASTPSRCRGSGHGCARRGLH